MTNPITPLIAALEIAPLDDHQFPEYEAALEALGALRDSYEDEFGQPIRVNTRAIAAYCIAEDIRLDIVRGVA